VFSTPRTWLFLLLATRLFPAGGGGGGAQGAGCTSEESAPLAAEEQHVPWVQHRSTLHLQVSQLAMKLQLRGEGCGWQVPAQPHLCN
jgi:hypothetical protein